MSPMAAAPPPPAAAPRLDTVLSFSDADAAASPHAEAEAEAESPATLAFSDAGSDTDTDADEGADFEFAFAPPLSPSAGGPAIAPADDLFAHGRLIPAYPAFDRHLLHDEAPSPDTYCAWAPRSAPGSPSRERDAPFPKSASTGEARRFWRLRDLVSGGGGRSHSDGKEKFVFLQQPSSNSKPAAAASPSKTSAHKAAAPVQKQGKKQHKGGKAAEMDMATAHRLFYGKPGAGDRARQQQQQSKSYLPYRPAIVGFFASAHALGRSHHPY